LFSLNRTALRRSGYRPSCYSKRVPVWAHCLYLREPETFLTMDGDVFRRRVATSLALAVAFQHFDLASDIVAVARRAQMLPAPDLSRLAAEVDRSADMSTRHLLRKAQEKGVAVTFMHRAFATGVSSSRLPAQSQHLPHEVQFRECAHDLDRVVDDRLRNPCHTKAA